MKASTLVLSFVVAGMLNIPAASAASNYGYMSANGAEPWGTSTNIQAMDAAFGAGQWDRVNFGDAYSGYQFLYVDGGDGTASDFVNWVAANQPSLETYVNGGGRLFLNAATWDQSTFPLLFGATSTEQGVGYSSYGYAVDSNHALFANGAGVSWQGNWFSHNAISVGGGFTTFITGDNGQTILAGGTFGDGYLMLGGQTNTNFHSSVNGSNPFQLRVNELQYVAGAVPEPETYAMLLVGLGLLGLQVRRKARDELAIDG